MKKETKTSQKILVIVNNIWPPPVLVTGVSIVYDCLKEFAHFGYEVHILTSVGLWEKNLQGSLMISDLGKVKKWHDRQSAKYNLIFHTYSLGFLNRLPGLSFFINRIVPFFIVPYLHQKYKFDLIHEYTSTPLLIFRSWFLKKILNVKTFHTLMTELPTLLGSTWWLSFMKPKIDGVICSDNSIAKNLISVEYPQVLIHSLSLGVDYKRLTHLPDRLSIRKKYFIKQAKKAVLFLAPLDSHKGPDIFVKACLKVIKSNLAKSKDFLFIIGTYQSGGKVPYGVRKSQILKMIKGKEEYFKIYEGLLKVEELYALSDIVVVPQSSIDGATGHPVTMLEAMTAKKIVIASDIAGIDEVVEDGDNGFLFTNKNPDSLAEKMLFVLQNLNNLGHVKRKALKTVEKGFKVDQIAKKLAIIYQGKKGVR